MLAMLFAVFAALYEAEPDAERTAVVPIFAGSELHCSGTMIAPRVVVTAAHCLTALVPLAAIAPDRFAIDAVVHPRFDPETLDFDVGLLLLEAPYETSPVLLVEGELGNRDLGLPVRIVGFGRSEVEAGSRRSGQGTIGGLSRGDFTIVPSPTRACAGDSGGPVLQLQYGEEVLTGIVSAGDPECVRYARAARIDVARDFILDYLASTAPGTAMPGDRCSYDAQCAAGACVPIYGDRICAVDCGADGTCAPGFVCQDAICVPLSGFEIRGGCSATTGERGGEWMLIVFAVAIVCRRPLIRWRRATGR